MQQALLEDGTLSPQHITVRIGPMSTVYKELLCYERTPRVLCAAAQKLRYESSGICCHPLHKSWLSQHCNTLSAMTF